ncbi:MAG: carboxypeptidase M32 [Acidobacteriota bacterium]|nr:carboxypeptidase M32 [Acidobacteriota bacterium]
MSQLDRLKSRMAEVSDLKAAAALLSWDQQTYMPSGGAAARAEQIATLEKLAHGRFVSEEVGAWLEGAAAETQAHAYESDGASLVRLTRRDYDKACRIPPALVEELARQTSLGMEVWVKARSQSDFSQFQGPLQTLVDLQRELADCLGYRERRYDALLDQYEPGMKSADLDRLFADLKNGLVPLVQDISRKLDSVQDEVLRQRFPIDKQTTFGLEMAKEMGFDLSGGRQDQSVHPFCTSFSNRDVRITTRFDERFLPSALFGTLHETGHALYEQGVSTAFERTPLSGGTSLGIHESQSRLWENLVGRSRGFWKFAYPGLQRAFPQQLAGCSLEAFYRAINRVEPSLIRVEADEVTYNLHIMLRYELEAQLVEDNLPVADLPEAWNGRMRDYLGITPPNDALGVLQDVHWSHGLFGYFPTYSLGNLISVQLYDRAKREIPGIPAAIERGEFSPLLGWLRERVHCHGRKFMPAELVRRITGEDLRAAPFVNYLKAKYGEIYN